MAIYDEFNLYSNNTVGAVLTSFGAVSIGNSIIRNDGTVYIKSADGVFRKSGSNKLTYKTNFGGDVTGTYDNISVNDNSHSHTIANVTNLQSSLDALSSAIGNVDSFSGFDIKVDSNASDTIAEAETINFVSGTNVTLGYNATTNTVTINSSASDNYGSWDIIAQDSTGAVLGTDAVESGKDVILKEGSNIELTWGDDGAGNSTITIASTASGGITSNSFETVAIDSTDLEYTWTADNGSVVSSSATDTLTYVAGNGIGLSVDSTNDAIKIDVTGSYLDLTGISTVTANNTLSGATVLSSLNYDTGVITGFGTRTLTIDDLLSGTPIADGAVTTGAGEIISEIVTEGGAITSITKSAFTVDLSTIGTIADFEGTSGFVDSTVTVDDATKMPIAGGEFTGNVSFNHTTVASTNIDCSLGNSFEKTITGSTTFTISNVPSGNFTITLLLVNGGSNVVTWPSSVKWSNGSAPTLTSSGTDLLVFMTVDGGTTWYGKFDTSFA